jgi:hypothetical protein
VIFEGHLLNSLYYSYSFRVLLQSEKGRRCLHSYLGNKSVKSNMGRGCLRVQVRSNEEPRTFPTTTFIWLLVNRPERWFNIPESASSIPGVFSNVMSFLGGARGCIGYRFAVIECVFSLHIPAISLFVTLSC